MTATRPVPGAVSLPRLDIVVLRIVERVLEEVAARGTEDRGWAPDMEALGCLVLGRVDEESAAAGSPAA